MRLILIRHGIAAPQGTPGISDDQRPLTPEGEKRFREAAKGLIRVVDRPDAILTSPLPRARRTAEIAAETWSGLKPRNEPALVESSLGALIQALGSYPEDASIALVGHEPHMSSLLAHILGSSHSEGFAFKKGGVALVEVPGRRLGNGQLVAFLPPRTLRQLAG